MRAALAWSIESGELELGLRLGSALEGFWSPRGYVTEGRSQLLNLLVQPEAAGSTAARANALSAAGLLTSLQGDLLAAQALYEESLAIWRRLEDRAGIATVLCHLGWMAVKQRDLRTARSLAEESLALRRDLGEPSGLADALALLAKILACEGDPTAGAVLAEAVATWRGLGDRVRVIGGLSNLALRAFDQADPDAARHLYQEMLATATEVGDRTGVAWATTGLGYVAWWREDLPAARGFFEQALHLWRELDQKHGLLETLCYLSTTIRLQGDHHGAFKAAEEMLCMARAGSWRCYVAGSLSLLGAMAGDLERWVEAANHCAESLKLSHSCDQEGYWLSIAWSLTGMARVSLARGRVSRAARLLGASERLWAKCTIPWWRFELDNAEAAVRAQLTEADFAATWAEGQAMAIKQAIAEALEEAAAG